MTNTGTISGGPRTIDVTTSGGNINIDVATVNVDNSTVNPGAGIAANNTGTGNVTIRANSVTVTGSALTRAIDAQVTTGNVVITNTGTIDASSNALNRGINAAANGGTITINSNIINGGFRGIFTGTVVGGVLPTSTTIVSNFVSSIGINQPNALIAQGGTVNVTSGTARNLATNGVSGTAIFVNAGTGGAIVRSGTADALGNNQAAIQIFSSGSVLLESTLATTTQTSDGLSVQGGTNVVINSGTVNTTGATGARAIVVNVPNAPVAITSGTISTTGTNSTGMLITGGTGAVTINSGTISTPGAGSDGINLLGGTGSKTVTSGTITAGGYGITLSGGAIDVTTTGNTVSSAFGGILANGTTVAIKTAGTTASQAGNFSAIGGFGTGSVTVNNAGLASAAGTTAAIQISATGTSAGAATVTSDVATNTGTGAAIIATGANGVTVTSNSASTANSAGNGIQAVATTAGNAVVNSGILQGSARANSIIAQSNTGTATVIAGSTTNANAESNAFGIFANGFTGATVTSGAVDAAGRAIRAQSTNGNVSVTTTGNILSRASNAISISGTSFDVTTASGTTVTSNGGTAAIAGGASAGNGSVTSNGTVAARGVAETGIGITTTGNATVVSNIITVEGTAAPTSGFSSGGISAVSSGGGNVAVTAQNTTVQGAGRYGIFASTTGAGTVRITSGTTSNVADGLAAVFAQSDTGAITLNTGTTTAASATAVFARTNGLATVNAASSTASGNRNSGVAVTGGTGVNLVVGSASSNGTSVTDPGTGVVTRADAVFAEAVTGAITATIGSATATGAGADAVRLIANGAGGAVTATVTGALNSTSGTGLFIDPPGQVTIAVNAGGSIQGGANGINTIGSANSITNAGTISSSAGAAILASGQTTLDNRGTIAGATGAAAVQLGATNDAVILRTGSVVTGAIVGGGGTDTATLIGTGTTPVANQTLAAFTGFDSLTVQNGYWTAPSTATSLFNRATINAGGALELANGATGIGGIATPSIISNGTLVVRSSTTSGAQSFGSTIVTGTGGVTFTGAGTATLAGTNSLQNTGTNIVDTGSTLLIMGTQGGAFVNNGTFQVGTGGTTGTYTGSLVNSGTLIINRSDAYSFVGALSGEGVFIKQGAGTVSFGSNYAFTGTTMLNGGGIRLATPVAANTELDVRGTGTVDFSGSTQNIAQLAGNSTTASVNIANGSLTTTQNTGSTFAGAITGNGSFTKSGTGNLNLTGANSYTGSTTVNGGTLSVNGSIVSPLTVTSGGTLGGTGTVGNTTISSGGVWAPGNSIGTQTVAGNVTFAAGSIYAVEANAAGQADRINATGTATLTGATVQVLAEAGTYAPLTSYTILTAQGGVNGTFAGATSNLAFLTPFLSYNANTVFLTLGRNDITFASQAVTNNQRGVAAAVQGRSLGDPIYGAVLMLTATGAQGAFDELSGEIHASLSSVLVDSNRRIRDAVFARGIQNSGDGFGMWAQGLQIYTDQRTQAGLASIESNRTGVYGGIDYTANGFRFGLSGGYLDDDVRLPGRASRANVSTKLVGGSIAWAPVDARLTAQVGGTYAWHDIDTTRTLTTAGLAGTLSARSEANSAQVFGELAYAVIQGPVAVSPFVRYTYGQTTVDALTETGGAAALRVGRERRDTNFASFGVKMSGATPITSGLMFEPRIVAAYVRGWNDLGGVRSASFAGAGPSFQVAGSRLGRDSLDIDIGFDLATTSGIRFGVGGFANTSKQWGDHGGRASVSIRF